jgi:aminopeptidase N
LAPVRESTAFTLGTDQPRTPEQLAVVFDKADLSIKVMPETKTIEAVAVLDFTATAPLAAVVVELDTLLAVSSVQVDGREIPAGEGGWSNPEGRMTIPLAEPLTAGGTVSHARRPAPTRRRAGYPARPPRPPAARWR